MSKLDRLLARLSRDGIVGTDATDINAATAVVNRFENYEPIMNVLTRDLQYYRMGYLIELQYNA